MEREAFENEVLERLRNVESDVSFIKGKTEGRGEKTTSRRDKMALLISVVSLVVALCVGVSRIW